MADRAELLAALNAALDTIGTKDAAEAERFLLQWEALLPFVLESLPEPPAKETASAVVVVSFEPEGDEEKADLEAIETKTRALLRKIDQRTPA